MPTQQVLCRARGLCQLLQHCQSPSQVPKALSQVLTLFFFSLEMGCLVVQAGHVAEDDISCLLCWDYRCVYHHSQLTWHWGWKPGFCGCQATTLPIEPQPVCCSPVACDCPVASCGLWTVTEDRHRGMLPGDAGVCVLVVDMSLPPIHL